MSRFCSSGASMGSSGGPWRGPSRAPRGGRRRRSARSARGRTSDPVSRGPHRRRAAPLPSDWGRAFARPGRGGSTPAHAAPGPRVGPRTSALVALVSQLLRHALRAHDELLFFVLSLLFRLAIERSAEALRFTSRPVAFLRGRAEAFLTGPTALCGSHAVSVEKMKNRSRRATAPRSALDGPQSLFAADRPFQIRECRNAVPCSLALRLRREASCAEEDRGDPCNRPPHR